MKSGSSKCTSSGVIRMIGPVFGSQYNVFRWPERLVQTVLAVHFLDSLEVLPPEDKSIVGFITMRQSYTFR